MRTIAALLLALTASSTAFAQNPEFVPQDPPPRDVPDFGLQVGVHGRYAIPFGWAESNIAFAAGGGGAIFLVDVEVPWSDLFHPGWGLDLELDLFIGRELPPPPGHYMDTMRYGFYLAASHDEFPGDDVQEDGHRIDAVDDLEISSLIVGAKLESSMGPGAFINGRFGLGAVRYSAVEATFSTPGFDPFRGELLDDTTTAVLDLRWGGGIELGPVNFTAGMGFRFMLPPSEGDVDFDAGLLMTFDLEVGIEIGF